MTLRAPIKTTCAYCGVGCGLVATPEGAEGWLVTGDPDHPANAGLLCSKGSALDQTLGLEGRLLSPRIDGEKSNWDKALDLVAEKFTATIKEHGPQSVAFYVSGQLLTEDYYVANKLMKGFIGAANIDTNSRLCMSSSVAGHKRAFGEDIVPGNYEDLDQADLMVLVGSNAAWCHPVLYQRMQAAQEEHGQKMVVIDPRGTATSQGAELHLPIKPGTDVALFNGLFVWLSQQGLVDQSYISDHTTGFEAALEAARVDAQSIDQVADYCGLEIKDLLKFYEMFGATKKVVTAFSQGVNQSSSGTDKVNAIINCHIATGRIGLAGMGPFSLTGQPNAMGGREVGGMANMLAAHMDIDNAAHRDLVQDFWQSPVMADQQGLKAIDLFDAMGRGDIKALWVMGTNPAVSLPDVGKVNEALAKCDFVVVSDIIEQTDTTQHADVLLPAAGWGEKDGTVTNSERRISRQKKFMPLPGEARPDWWIICEVARRMGFGDAFAYDNPAAIFREHAALSGYQNDGQRLFDISALANMDEAAYDNLQPIQWPVTSTHPTGTPRCFPAGGFTKPEGRASFLAVTARPPGDQPDADFPLVLNSGRVRDQWHTMTRTGAVPQLSFHMSEPIVDVSPEDAQNSQLQDGALAKINTRHGQAIARVNVSDHMVAGSIFLPIHWSETNAAQGRVGDLVNAFVDPVSGQPELKHTPATIAPYQAAWHAFLLTKAAPNTAPNIDGIDFWVRAQGDGFALYELAGDTEPLSWSALADQLLGDDDGVELLAYSDAGRGNYRFAQIRDDQLNACLIMGRDHHLLPRSWLMSLVGVEISALDRQSILAGRPAKGADTGAIICSCFSIGLNQITDCLKDGRATNIEEIGKALSAGTNCGSCLPELKEIVAARHPQPA
ncbi:MAG: nitrate reductase [Alphaproteobacteria bacterium]|nr:MAG: nitrate reductase [Alphaproteobacteria bacterium]